VHVDKEGLKEKVKEKIKENLIEKKEGSKG
jgi:hypothetical protein